MAKLSGFKKVARIFIGCKDYYYALYDDDICIGDDVLVTGAAKDQIRTVSDILPVSNIGNINITAEVVCKVDLSKFNERCRIRKSKEKLRKELDKKRKEIESKKTDEYYASLDPEYAKMLREFNELEY